MRAGRSGTAKARRLRRDATEAEKHLWHALRELGPGWHFRRQHPIPPHTVDFACVTARLAVEADGGQHGESESDARRDPFLRREDWRILRFWNNDILANRDGVLQTIIAAPAEDPLPRPSPAGGGGGKDEAG